MHRMVMRYRSSSWALLALAAAAGCYTSTPLRTPAPARASVRVRFNPPETLHASAPGREAWRVDGVTEVAGRLLGVRGDTLHLELSRVLTGRSMVNAGGRTALVVPQRGRPAEVRKFSASRTAVAVLLPPALVVLWLLIYVSCCFSYT